eukprot:2981197-Prymnesium_polylepis.1
MRSSSAVAASAAAARRARAAGRPGIAASVVAAARSAACVATAWRTHISSARAAVGAARFPCVECEAYTMVLWFRGSRWGAGRPRRARGAGGAC